MARTRSRLIVVTGVTRGLGRAMVEKFISLGHTVFGCGRNAGDIARLGERFGRPHEFATVDVASWAQVEPWADRLMQRHNPPDLLINNAGIINANAPLWQVSAGEFDRVMAVNVNGVANVLRAFLPAMVPRKAGVIVNFSSGWGRSVAADVAPYCASKFAIEGLTKALAEDLPSGMAAVPLDPGVIQTDMLRSAFGEAAASYPSPEKWVEKAAPLILKIGPRESGKSMKV